MKKVFIAVAGNPDIQQLHNPRLKATYENGYVVYEGILSLLEFNIILESLKGIASFKFWDMDSMSEKMKEIIFNSAKTLRK